MEVVKGLEIGVNPIGSNNAQQVIENLVREYFEELSVEMVKKLVPDCGEITRADFPRLLRESPVLQWQFLTYANTDHKYRALWIMSHYKCGSVDVLGLALMDVGFPDHEYSPHRSSTWLALVLDTRVPSAYISYCRCSSKYLVADSPYIGENLEILDGFISHLPKPQLFGLW